MAHSEATKRKISQALLGHKVSEATLSKLRGKKRSQKFKDRMRELALGRPAWNKGKKLGNRWPNSGQFKKGQLMPKSIREKISKALRGKKRSPVERERNRQSQYRRFEREIPGYNFADDGRRLRRKVRLRKNGGHHSKAEWEELKRKCKFSCLMCFKSEPTILLTKDHIIPVLLGGTDNIENIQPLCRSCNASKSTKLVENRVNSGEVPNGLS